MEYNYDNMFYGNLQYPCMDLMQMRAMAMMPPQMPIISDDFMGEEIVDEENIINEDEEKYVEEYREEDVRVKGNCQNEVDRILRKIQRNNPGIYRTFRGFGVPYPVATRLTRRIIVLTLQYGNCSCSSCKNCKGQGKREL